jgi:hypothetical protein
MWRSARLGWMSPRLIKRRTLIVLRPPRYSAASFSFSAPCGARFIFMSLASTHENQKNNELGNTCRVSYFRIRRFLLVGGRPGGLALQIGRRNVLRRMSRMTSFVGGLLLGFRSRKQFQTSIVVGGIGYLCNASSYASTILECVRASASGLLCFNALSSWRKLEPSCAMYTKRPSATLRSTSCLSSFSLSKLVALPRRSRASLILSANSPASVNVLFRVPDGHGPSEYPAELSV